jgi:hypothetical protein
MPASFKAILPKAFVNQFAKEFSKEMANMLNEVNADFQRTTRTWNHKPPFEIVLKRNAEGLVGSVTTDDKIYLWVDKGTKPHKIRPKKGGWLVFRSQYRAKTRPTVIGSTPGGASGRTVAVQRPVNHPGTKARKFSKTIAKKYKPRFKKLMERALATATSKSGHKI